MRISSFLVVVLLPFCASATVKTDQHVTANQTIGTVANNEFGEPTVKFQIWKITRKGSVSLNPEQWIGKAR
jgi:septal ring factor EnvC (AmiA/AmiB activator)